ncbi:hypothetical protein FJ420_04160 [Mesorhizobium sp. B3-1-3]|nr:hypothetical protein FJ424_06245 [Mesorhizobium sp. B3-1-8]TPI74757.1 hypothetical protein FJ420_04160 [Mesorhizobium sp. B3-1-3]
MNRTVFIALAILVATGSAFTGSDRFPWTNGGQQAAAVDTTTTASSRSRHGPPRHEAGGQDCCGRARPLGVAEPAGPKGPRPGGGIEGPDAGVRKARLALGQRPDVPISPEPAGLQSDRPAPVPQPAEGRTGPSANLSYRLKPEANAQATRGDFRCST